MRDTAQIVADHVDDHDILRTVFLGLRQPGCALLVLAEGAAALDRALHGPAGDAGSLPAKEQLGRDAADHVSAGVEERGVGLGLRPEQAAEQVGAVAGVGGGQAEGVIDLVGFAAFYGMHDPPDVRLKPIGVDRWAPIVVLGWRGGTGRRDRFGLVVDAEPEQGQIGIRRACFESRIKCRRRLVGDEAHRGFAAHGLVFDVPQGVLDAVGVVHGDHALRCGGPQPPAAVPGAELDESGPGGE